MQFSTGQRWVSQAEPKLGLGIVVNNADRLIEIYYPAVEEQRTYRADAAPLSRIIYRAGEAVQDSEGGHHTVLNSTEHNGIVVYHVRHADGTEGVLPEIQLAADVHLHSPLDKLTSGQLSKPKEYALRRRLISAKQHAEGSECRGLLGGRVSLLPHQIYIATEVGQRLSPRVLLADEVGLGKTIEAGLILHQQLLTERAKRVLIAVPNSLVHQWLVEMLRRVNIICSVFDESRCEAIEEEGNPFESEQCIICDLDWLAQSPKRLAQANSAKFDILLIDEAHNLHWGPDGACDAYRAVEMLSANIPGLLLLTATPEQAGLESHFARLRLLDPERFHDYGMYVKETQHYAELNQLIEQLGDSATVPFAIAEKIAQHFNEPDLASRYTDRDQLIAHLLDRHGTGRVMFRNSRHRIKGFPERHLAAIALPSPYSPSDWQAALYPEQTAGDDWCQHDPRVAWLSQFLRRNKQEKVLLICAHRHSAEAIEQHLRLREGIAAADFHEGLSILERDRAAAYFADSENGAQILVCSEIGSEGRNFQFAKHLVLFDLPQNPDLLEQRIGRIDRIGQGSDIYLHVPYFEHTAQERLFHWYHRGLEQFGAPFSGGHSLFEKYRSAFEHFLSDEKMDETWLAAINQEAKQLRQALESGRDRLLELNSCREDIAQQWIQLISAAESSDDLESLFEDILDFYGVDSELGNQQSLVLHQGEQRTSMPFPLLGEDGMTVTFDRNTALANEDVHFLTWEHPIISQSIEGIVHGEPANCCIGKLSLKGLAPGTMLVECQFSLECLAPDYLHLPRYLNEAAPRVLLTHEGRDLSHLLPADALDHRVEKLPKPTALQVANQQRSVIEKLVALAERQVATQRNSSVATAVDKLQQHLGGELSRLRDLAKHNPTVSEKEMRRLADLLDAGTEALQHSRVVLNGLRIVVAV
ncbi:MAG TPA: RNA polymerase-associated protein RapA [Pseudomonadales bacterium]|nr:RNA polymerase-associated protein RapA [Pseudomonadales bacterium]